MEIRPWIGKLGEGGAGGAAANESAGPPGTMSWASPNGPASPSRIISWMWQSPPLLMSAEISVEDPSPASPTQSWKPSTSRLPFAITPPQSMPASIRLAEMASAS